MNYIQKLQKENQLLKECLDELTIYINSSKFSENPMVNKNDINLRISEYNRKIFELE